MTRIHRPGLLLGALLLLNMLMEPCAFTINRQLSSPFQARRHVGRFFVSTADQDCMSTDQSLPGLQQEPNNFIVNIMEVNDSTKTVSRLPWLFMAVVAFLQIQFFKTSTVLGADTFALSTVSTTLLRRHHGVRPFSTQQLLAFSVLSWQVISNFGNFIGWMQMTGAVFSAWYMSSLSAFPVLTKALTTAVIGLMGDTAAQFIEERIRSRKDGAPSQFRGRYDRRRGLANVADGFFVTGPLLHFSYNLLETLIPVSGAATGLGASLAALSQVLIDDIVLDAMFVAVMFVTTGLGEGYKMRDIRKQFRKDYVGAVRTSWATSFILMPLEFLLFRFFPLHVRVLGMNLIDIIWEGMVSYLVHKRRKGASGLEEETKGITTMLHMERAAVPAH
jgi:hypothetical protein